MFRTVCAVVIFTVTVFLCILSLFFLKNTTSEITKNLDSALEFLAEEKTEFASREINTANDKWEKSEKILKWFIDHSHLEEINVSFAELKSNLASNEFSQSLAICKSILVRIKGLEETEEPYLENIL